MAEQFQIVGIKKPGGSGNRTTHITDVLVQRHPTLNPYDILDSIAFGPPVSPIARTLRPRPLIPEWRTVRQVIDDIEAGNEYYYTDNGKRAEVIVVPLMLLPLRLPGGGFGRAVPSGRKYIRTRSDSTRADNLLSLPNHYGK
jgi:hypothetical protein